MDNVKTFLEKNFKHFNAATLVDAAKAYTENIKNGDKMLVSLGGAMSTAEIGISLANMIREDKVHIISATGANLEEDIMNLIAHSKYMRVANYRELSAEDETRLYQNGYNRVTDTCIPEGEAFRVMEKSLEKIWKRAEAAKLRYFPHEFIFQLLDEEEIKNSFDINPDNSWVLAAKSKQIPIVVPGWEDSTTGNIFASYCIKKELTFDLVKNGIEYMDFLAHWYLNNTQDNGMGFFQIGGGIAGDFPICVVPMLHQDLGYKNVRLWNYFCQISDSTTSYGSYSGAAPNEKITWGKLDKTSNKFIIESDASIVVPLMFEYILSQ